MSFATKDPKLFDRVDEFVPRRFMGSEGEKMLKQEHRDLAREAVRKSLVLLKNGKSASQPLLPLDKNAPKILVAGTDPDNLGYQCGGWTIEWQGLSGNITIGTTILSAIQSAVSSSTEVVYQQNPDANYVKEQGFSFAIVVVGEPPYAEMFGDNLNSTISLGGGDTINNVCGSLKCLIILISGRTLVIEPYLPLVDAFVAAWLPGTEGQRVTDVIFGDYSFQGKQYDPQFPLGFGLTTTVAENIRSSSFGVLSKEVPSVLAMIIILCLHMYTL